ncbi:MAG: glycosyltransferase family 29 protein [Paracoccaceae bacterium]
MSSLRFLYDRILRPETLNRFSIPQTDLLAALTNRTIAIVGNARSLSTTDNGPKIDAADIVIRINRAPMPAATSHGTKTNWLALATSLPRQDFTRINPDRTLWMSHKRKRLAQWIAQTEGFYLHPQTDWQRLQAQLGGPPSTGAMVIDLAHRSKARSIDLYGFDFFASKSLSGSRDATQVPHDFSAEKHYVQTLLAKDSRFTLHN